MVGSTVLASAQLVPQIPDDWSAIDDAILHGTITPPGAEIQEKSKELEAYDELVYGYPRAALRSRTASMARVHADLARVLGHPIQSPTSQIYCGSTGVGVDGGLVSCANALAASLEAISPSNASASSERILFLPTAALSMHWVNRPTTQGLSMFPEPSRALLLGSGIVLVGLLARLRRRR